MSKTAIKDLIIVSLALLSAAMLIFEIVVMNLSPFQKEIIELIDISIALVFLYEFLYRLYKAENRGRFLARRWWEILAAIPLTSGTTQALRIFRIERLLPLIEVLRFVRLTSRLKILLDFSYRFTRHAIVLYSACAVTIIILGFAFLFFNFENGVNPHVKDYWDGVWWAIVTATTIGYGDIYPVTLGGRITAIFLMFIGISALGTFIAGVDSLFIRRYLKKPILKN